MSVKWMSYIWEERTDLKGAELLLAVAIADHADNEGRCYPGIESLCLKMRLKERQVQDLIKRLEKKQVFDVIRGNGRGHLTSFQFKRVQVSASINETERVQDSTPFEEEKGAGFCKERVQVSATPPTPPYKDNHLIESSTSTEERNGVEIQPKTDVVEEENLPTENSEPEQPNNPSYQPERTKIGRKPIQTSFPSADVEIWNKLDWVKTQMNLMTLSDEMGWTKAVVRCDSEQIDFQEFYGYINTNKSSKSVTADMMQSDHWIAGFKRYKATTTTSPPKVLDFQINELLATQAKRPLRQDEVVKLKKLQEMANV